MATVTTGAPAVASARNRPPVSAQWRHLARPEAAHLLLAHTRTHALAHLPGESIVLLSLAESAEGDGSGDCILLDLVGLAKSGGGFVWFMVNGA